MLYVRGITQAQARKLARDARMLLGNAFACATWHGAHGGRYVLHGRSPTERHRAHLERQTLGLPPIGG